MKHKIFLLILILIVGSFAWRIFISNFSQDPIEIIIDSKENEIEKITNMQSTSASEKTKPEETALIPKEEKNPSDDLALPPKNEVTEVENDSFVNKKLVSWGYSISANRDIDTVLIHSSYDALGEEPYDLEGLIKEYQQYGVAPHFLIDRKGRIYQLVDEKNIAYHAGISEMPDGRTGVNGFSIGIEMMNTKEDKYTNKQYSNLNDLINYLEKKHPIKYVLGHKDVSPDRKTDPWNFDWKEVDSKKSIH